MQIQIATIARQSISISQKNKSIFILSPVPKINHALPRRIPSIIEQTVHHRHHMPVKPQHICTMREVAAEFIHVHRIVRLIPHISAICTRSSNTSFHVRFVALQHARMAQSPTRLLFGFGLYFIHLFIFSLASIINGYSIFHARKGKSHDCNPISFSIIKSVFCGNKIITINTNLSSVIKK